MSTGSIFRTLSRHWLTVGFFFGFITDFILLNRVDDVFDNLILLFHVTLATLSLLLFYAAAAERLPEKTSHFLRRITPLTMQYAFGGLLSGMLIFYGRSSDLLVSAPFLLLILAVILGNEFIDKRSDRLVYQVSLYFIGLFSYVVLIVPVLTGKMGDAVFFLSGVAALGIVTGIVQLLYKIMPTFMALQTKRLIFALGSIYVLFNLLYLTNIIPPIPLSLTALTVSHSVERTSTGDYRVIYEEQPWWRALPYTTEVLHPSRGQVACFAQVYAPTRLSTTIQHRWEYFDTVTDAWNEYFILDYPISGDNSKGYRGYTRITNYFPGLWRCTVETRRGQVLGRVTFEIADGPSRELVTRIE